MVEKKKAPAKKAAPVKKTTRRRATASKKTVQGETYACEVCGLAVTVDEECGCVETCDIICCDQPMKQRTPRTRAKATAK